MANAAQRMTLRRSLFHAFAFTAAIAWLPACQGNLGSGSGLSIPQAPGAPGQQGGGGAAAAASREHAVEGADFLAKGVSDVTLPTVDGFAIVVALGPAPSPSPLPSVGPTSSPGKSSLRRMRDVAVAQAATASPSSSPATTASPAASSSPAASPSPSARPSGPVNHHPRVASSPTGPKIETKMVVYPDDAPVAPSPAPSGNVQTFPERKAIARGYVMPSIDLPIYGLAAVRFTVPSSEMPPGRGFTIAVFTAAKKHRGKVLDYDTAPVVTNNTIASSYADDPFTLKHGEGYEIVLYGDALAATPAPVVSSYPSPGTNPFVTPVPPGLAQSPGPAGYPAPYSSPTPYHP